jgi:hypothetical protein
MILFGKSAEGGFWPPTPCPPMAVGPDRTKLWHPLGAPDASPPHAGGLLGSKRVLDFVSGPSANPNSVAEILLARPPKKPCWHPTGAVPIPHTTTHTLPTGPPTAAVHTRTVHERPRAAGAERSLDTLPSVSQAFVPSQTPNFVQISPKRAPKSPHGGLKRPPEPERGPPAPARAAPTRVGGSVGRRAYKYGAPAECAGGPSLDECTLLEPRLAPMRDLASLYFLRASYV